MDFIFTTKEKKERKKKERKEKERKMNKTEEIYIIILFILNCISFTLYFGNIIICKIFEEKYYEIKEDHPRMKRRNIIIIKELFFPLIIVLTILTESEMFDNFATSSVFIHSNFLTLQVVDYLMYYTLLSRKNIQLARVDTLLDSATSKKHDFERHLLFFTVFMLLIEFASILFMFSTLHTHHLILCMMSFYPLYIVVIIISFVRIFNEDGSLILNQIIFSSLNLLFCIIAFLLIYIAFKDDISTMNFLSGVIIWASSTIFICFNKF